MNIELLLTAARYLDSQQHTVDNAWLRCDHGYALSTQLPSRRRPSKSLTSSYKRTLHRTGRSMHNELEKTRRANLRQCFESLRDTMPASAAGRTTTLQLLKRAQLHITRLEADYRSHEEMKASLMEQQRQLNACLLLHRRRRRRRHQQQQHSDDNDDDTAAAFAGVVVVKETGTCRGHVTSFVDDIEETASNSDSGASSLVMSTSSDNDDVDIMGSASDCDDYLRC